MVNDIKCRTEIQEDEKCDALLFHVEGDGIGYLQERSTFRLGNCVQEDYVQRNANFGYSAAPIGTRHYSLDDVLCLSLSALVVHPYAR